MSRMDRILQINGKPNIRFRRFNSGVCRSDHNYGCIDWTEADGDVVVEPGVKWEDLNAELKKKGIPLFFPVSRLLDSPPKAALISLNHPECSSILDQGRRSGG